MDGRHIVGGRKSGDLRRAGMIHSDDLISLNGRAVLIREYEAHRIVAVRNVLNVPRGEEHRGGRRAELRASGHWADLHGRFAIEIIEHALRRDRGADRVGDIGHNVSVLQTNLILRVAGADVRDRHDLRRDGQRLGDAGLPAVGQDAVNLIGVGLPQREAGIPERQAFRLRERLTVAQDDISLRLAGDVGVPSQIGRRASNALGAQIRDRKARHIRGDLHIASDLSAELLDIIIIGVSRNIDRLQIRQSRKRIAGERRHRRAGEGQLRDAFALIEGIVQRSQSGTQGDGGDSGTIGECASHRFN